MPRVYTVDSARPRERMLAAAEKVLRAEGIGAVSARRVAADLGVTAMAMYRHFKDKDALVDALIAAGFEKWEARLAEAVQTSDAAGRLEAALTAYREFALAEPRYFELMFLVPRRNVPLAPESLRVTPSPSFGIVIATVHECMTTGTLLPGDPGQVILMMWSLAHGLVALHFTGRFGYDETLFRRRYDEAVALLLARLRRAS